MQIRNVLIIGGSGFIGRNFAARLAARGIFVRVPTRNRERVKQDLILLPAVDVVQADIQDDEVLKQLIGPADAVVNLVGILQERRSGQDFRQAHVELPRRIIAHCNAAHVRRYLQMSALGADPSGPSAYQRSKGEAERIVRAAQSPELQTTLFRPSVVFGRGDSFLNLFVQLARWLPIMAVASPDARFQPIWVEDVARAMESALDDPRTYGQSYDLCGPQDYALRELVKYACRIAGLRRPVIGLGPSLSRLQAVMLEHLPGALMTRDNLLSMRVDNVCGCPFPEVFGFTPSAVEAVVPTYLGPGTREARLDAYRVRAGR